MTRTNPDSAASSADRPKPWWRAQGEPATTFTLTPTGVHMQTRRLRRRAHGGHPRGAGPGCARRGDPGVGVLRPRRAHAGRGHGAGPGRRRRCHGDRQPDLRPREPDDRGLLGRVPAQLGHPAPEQRRLARHQHREPGARLRVPRCTTRRAPATATAPRASSASTRRAPPPPTLASRRSPIPARPTRSTRLRTARPTGRTTSPTQTAPARWRSRSSPSASRPVSAVTPTPRARSSWCPTTAGTRRTSATPRT